MSQEANSFGKKSTKQGIIERKSRRKEYEDVFPTLCPEPMHVRSRCGGGDRQGLTFDDHRGIRTHEYEPTTCSPTGRPPRVARSTIGISDSAVHIYARSEYHTQLAKMSFDKIFDLPAGVYFNFCSIHRYLRFCLPHIYISYHTEEVTRNQE